MIERRSGRDRRAENRDAKVTAGGELSRGGVERLLETGRGQNMIVLGDLMLDEWIMGDASRISPEAPVPVVRFSQRRIAPGGAANVSMNLLSLGAQSSLCGLIGDDGTGDDLTVELARAGANTSGLVRDATRPTTLKTRVVAQRQQMVRIDRESDAPLAREIIQRLHDSLSSLLDGAALLCVSDYDKGLATCGVVARAIAGARDKGVRVAGGPKPHNLDCFTKAHFLSLNQKEAAEASGLKFVDDAAVDRSGTLLRERTQAEALVITRGGRGATLFEKDKAPRHIAGHEVEVFDITGAGDTFLSAAALALAGGASYIEAAELGNLAAAASVRHVGVAAVSPEEVLQVAYE